MLSRCGRRLQALLLSAILHTQDIYLIRHAQGFHNLGREHHCDAHLTARGWRQTDRLREFLQAHRVAPEVVYISPLTRTLETAAGVFGLPGSSDDVLMNHQTLVPGLRCQAGPIAIGSTTTRYAALELCRERVGTCY